MDELKKLKELFEGKDGNGGLVSFTDPDEIVKRLQEIGKHILNKLVIEIENIIIEPVLVEAYYYDSDKFRDCNTYGAYDPTIREKQSNRFNRLFIHDPSKHSKGIDVVLSNGNYCLSYLIKNSVVYYEDNSEFCSQEKLDSKLCELLGEKYDNIENIEDVLKVKSQFGLKSTNSDGLFAKRKGTSKGAYSDIATACVLLDKINDWTYSFEDGKERVIARYIFEKNIEPTDENIIRFFGSRSKNVKTYIEQLKQGKEI